MSIRNMTVRLKLASTFGALALMVLVVSILSLRALSESNGRFEAYVKGIGARAAMAEQIRTAVDRRAIAVRNLVLVTKPEDLAAERLEVSQAYDDVERHLEQLEKMVQAPGVPDQVRAMVGRMDEVEQEYGPIALAIVKLATDGKRDEAIAKIIEDCRPHLAALVKATEDYHALTLSREEAQLDAAQSAYSTQRNILLAACFAAFAAAVTGGFLIARSLSGALGAEPAELGAAAQRVANGELFAIPGAESAPPGSVLASLGSMQVDLANVVGQVRGASESIATGSSEIASGNADLSQRTEEQATALQQAAATMTQLGETVGHNADNARQASQLAVGASDAATRGGEVVSRVVSTMKGINDGSRRISEIIGVIDGIAFQTNILSLNAAVEAARAGAQGRGFAVVASEVRSLAHRSAEAAREIKHLITDSVEQVAQGAVLVDEAGRTMAEIVEATKRVADIVAEISAASVEQSSGVTQVGQAVIQMDQVTQQNAALVEESAAAAESLSEQARRLVEVMTIFKIEAPFAATGSAVAALKPDQLLPEPVAGSHGARSPVEGDWAAI